MDTLPCGCRMGSVSNSFVIEPCSLDCEYALYAIAQSKRLGKPIRAMDAVHRDSVPTFATIPCPHCGRMNDAHTRDTGDQPTPGDLAVCWQCRKFSIYEGSAFGLTQRAPTAEEQHRLDNDPEAQSMLVAMRESYSAMEAVDFARKLRRS